MQRISQSELRFKQINGPFSYYLNWNETALLVALIKSVRPKVVLEFGTNRGMTARRILDNVPTIERYIGIDLPADRVPTLACQRTEVPSEAGAEAASDPRFFLLLRESKALTIDQLEPADAAFIDGDHSEEGVFEDSTIAAALVRRGGILVWHDYNNPAVGVTAVLDRLCEQGWPIVSIEGSWIAYCYR
jgi:predicted O-methyltransferase YrrM